MKELVKKLDKNLRITGYKYEDDTLIINVERKSKNSICPDCGKKSAKVNTRYTREIKDLPVQEDKVVLIIQARIFDCVNKKCIRKRFAERFDFIEKKARMTSRLKNRIIEDSKGMSARAAKKSINEGLVNISDDTILRMIKKNYKKPQEK